MDGVNRDMVQKMVEDHWRGFLAASAAGNTRIGSLPLQFDERVRAIADLMSPEASAAFQQAIDNERGKLAAEYHAGPEALKRRLGLLPHPAETCAIERDDLAEVAARTFIQATVWQSVSALFRVFR